MNRTRKTLAAVGAGVCAACLWPAASASAEELPDLPDQEWTYPVSDQGMTMSFLDTGMLSGPTAVGGYLNCPTTHVTFWKSEGLKNIFGNTMLYWHTQVDAYTDCGVTWGAGNPVVTAWVSDNAKLAGWKFDRVANYWVKNFKDGGQATGGIEWYDYGVFLYRSNPGGLWENDWQPWHDIKMFANGALYPNDGNNIIEYRTHQDPLRWIPWNG